MNEDDIICLSSSDEDEPPQKKRKSLEHSEEDKNQTKENGKVICLDSEEGTDSEEKTDSEEVIIVGKKVNGAFTPRNTDETAKHELDEVKCNIAQDIETKKTDLEFPDTNNEPIEELQTEKSADEQKAEIVDIDSCQLADVLERAETLPPEALSFITTCRDKLQGTPSSKLIFKKFPKIIGMFEQLKEEFAKSEYLKKFLNKQINYASRSVTDCIVSFKDVYQHLKSSLDSEGVELSKKHRKFVKKLEETMNKLVEKLKEFDETEVDFNVDEDTTAYIKHDRYAQRLNTVYKKYCKILKKNPYAGRITRERLDFVSSQYNEINIAICKKYKNNNTFPSYDELSAYIEGVSKESNLCLSSAQLKSESEHCFKKLGDLLQLRRKKELYEAQCSFIINKEDPAEKDKELDSKLRISSKEGKAKIDEVCEEFCRKQELAIDNYEEFDCSDANSDEDQDEIQE